MDPPGEARPDFEIFLEYPERLELTDKNGAPLVNWRTQEECFDAFKEMTRGRPCDYSGLSYGKLRGGSGIQWPWTTIPTGRSASTPTTASTPTRITARTPATTS